MEVRRCDCGNILPPHKRWCSDRCFYLDEPTAREDFTEIFEDDEYPAETVEV